VDRGEGLKMTIRSNGDDGNYPRVCGDCRESYWEEMMYGEDAYCAKYKALCTSAIRDCDLICRCCK